MWRQTFPCPLMLPFTTIILLLALWHKYNPHRDYQEDKPDLSWPVCSQQKGYKTKKKKKAHHAATFILHTGPFLFCLRLYLCLSVLNPWGIHLHTLHLYYHWIIGSTLGLFWVKDFQIDRSVVDEQDGSILTPQCQLLISEPSVLTAVGGSSGARLLARNLLTTPTD